MNFRELQKCIVELEIPYDVELRVECWNDPTVHQGLYVVEENVLYLGDNLENIYETIIEDYRMMGIKPPLFKWYRKNIEY